MLDSITFLLFYDIFLDVKCRSSFYLKEWKSFKENRISLYLFIDNDNFLCFTWIRFFSRKRVTTLKVYIGFQSCSPNPTNYDKKWSYRRIDFIPHVLLIRLVLEYVKWANFLSIVSSAKVRPIFLSVYLIFLARNWACGRFWLESLFYIGI